MKTILSVLLVLLAAVSTAYAATGNSDVGAAEIDLFITILTGNIGIALGLGVAIIGIFRFISGNVAGGITMVVLGVIITLMPAIYNGLRLIVCPIATSLGGHCDSNSVS
jgi:hypothetical protein